MNRRAQLMSLLPFIAATSLTSALAAWFTESTVHTWYQTLAKPDWTPAPKLFGPVWTLLYALMALAAWRIWRFHREQARTPLTLFGIQLVLNALWPACFFLLKNPLLGGIELTLLWAAVIATNIRFIRLDKLAGWMLLPYSVWGSFALVLTWTVWSLNR
jgi:benzodiazapine receptor